MDNTTSTRLSTTTIVAAAIFAIAVVVAIYLLWHPGAEVPNPSGAASNAVAPPAQTTPDLSGDTSTNETPAPPDTTGAGPPTAKTP
jgi:hypothetical protein